MQIGKGNVAVMFSFTASRCVVATMLRAVLDALGSTLSGFFIDLKSALPQSPFYRAVDLTEIGRPGSLAGLARRVKLRNPLSL